MDDLTRKVLFSRLRDPALMGSVLDPYSEERRRGTPRGRTPPLEKREQDGGVYRPENIRQKSIFNWGPDYTRKYYGRVWKRGSKGFGAKYSNADRGGVDSVG
jgi:hypothetical protein